MSILLPISAKRPPRRTECGVALVIVLISIFVLTMLAGGFALSMKVETRLARNANAEAELEWLGRSAVECARWELSQQAQIREEPYDGLDQVWAGGPGGMGTSNSPLADFRQEIQTPDGHSGASWTIVDLERKANINTALLDPNHQKMLEQALTEVAGVPVGDSTPIVNSILDWIDSRSTHERPQGAKDDFYKNYGKIPYTAKNGPMDDISELLLIKGITEELYYGIPATNYMGNAYTPGGRDYGPGRSALPAFAVALTNIFTPLSSGKINVNTASAEVLQCIPGLTPEMAQAIVGARSGEPDPMGMTGPYRSIQDLHRVPEIPIPVLGALQQFCDVRSRTFEVHVNAQVGGYHRHFIGILGRGTNPKDIQILSFYWID